MDADSLLAATTAVLVTDILCKKGRRRDILIEPVCDGISTSILDVF